MIVQLPLTPSVPNYRVGTTVEGIPLVFDVRWNDREQSWYLDFFEEDETPILHGVKVTLGTFLGARSPSAELPPGFFIASDLSGEGAEAGLDDLGARVAVYYYTIDEFE